MAITERPPTEQRPILPPARRGISTPQIVGGGVLVLIGLLWLLERTGAIDVSVTAVLALATMVIGITLMLLAREGSHIGLIVFGIILALATLVTAVAPFEGFQGGLGERVFEVSSVEDIRADYNVAMGTLTIDLREIDDLSAAAPLSASVGMGELIVRVPEGIAIRVEANVGAGEVEILGRATSGVGLDESYETPGFDESREGMSLDLQVFTGRVEVKND